MKKRMISVLALLFYVLFLSLVSISLAWFCGAKIIDPNILFSAGAPEEYDIYKIVCENDSSVHTVTEVDTVGTDGFSVSDLQLGKISNLSVLEHSNYIYYAIRIPKTDGEKVSLGVGYGDLDSDGKHFKIFVPSKDLNGEIEYEANGSIKTIPFENQAALEEIENIETDNSATFICCAYALSDKSPYDYQNIDELEALFSDKEAVGLDSLDEDGEIIPDELTMELSSVAGDYYYAYIKLEPNVSLYKHFIEYLWNNMPFFLAYEIRVTLNVAPNAE